MSFRRVSDSSLHPSEKEERQIERLMPSGRKPHPKKKHRTKRTSPRADQRRIRIKESDSDLKSGVGGDPDLSLSNRLSSLFIRIAEQISDVDRLDLINRNKLREYKVPFFGSLTEYSKLDRKINDISSKISDLFKEEIKKTKEYKNLQDEISRAVANHERFRELRLENSIKDYGCRLCRTKGLIVVPDPTNVGLPVTIQCNKCKAKESEKDFYRRTGKTVGSIEYSMDLIRGFENANGNFSTLINRESNLFDSAYAHKLPKTALPIINDVQKYWETSSTLKWATRAGILKRINESIKNDFPNISQEIRDFYSRDPLEDPDPKLIDVFADLDLKKLNLATKDYERFATLAALYQNIAENPESIDWSKIEHTITQTGKKIQKDISNVIRLRGYIEDIESSQKDFLKGIKHALEDDDPTESKLDKLDSALRSLQKGAHIFDYEKSLQKLKELKKRQSDLLMKHGLPEEEIPAVYKAAFNKPMNVMRTAKYNGILQQGHPSGPTNTGWNSIDKRYIGEVHYESILASAKKMLKDNPWFQHCWGNTNNDAMYRAALDLSIATTDNNIYQSKIDAPTYEQLLNRLAKWDYDTFSDTVLNMHSNPKKRNASEDPLIDLLRWSEYL